QHIYADPAWRGGRRLTAERSPAISAAKVRVRAAAAAAAAACSPARQRAGHRAADRRQLRANSGPVRGERSCRRLGAGGVRCDGAGAVLADARHRGRHHRPRVPLGRRHVARHAHGTRGRLWVRRRRRAHARRRDARDEPAGAARIRRRGAGLRGGVVATRGAAATPVRLDALSARDAAQVAAAARRPVLPQPHPQCGYLGRRPGRRKRALPRYAAAERHLSDGGGAQPVLLCAPPARCPQPLRPHPGRGSGRPPLLERVCAAPAAERRIGAAAARRAGGGEGGGPGGRVAAAVGPPLRAAEPPLRRRRERLHAAVRLALCGDAAAHDAAGPAGASPRPRRGRRRLAPPRGLGESAGRAPPRPRRVPRHLEPARRLLRRHADRLAHLLQRPAGRADAARARRLRPRVRRTPRRARPRPDRRQPAPAACHWQAVPVHRRGLARHNQPDADRDAAARHRHRRRTLRAQNRQRRLLHHHQLRPARRLGGAPPRAALPARAARRALLLRGAQRLLQSRVGGDDGAGPGQNCLLRVASPVTRRRERAGEGASGGGRRRLCVRVCECERVVESTEWSGASRWCDAEGARR
ncbi:hypothetical protein EMIHUDRAFT_436522, partial [Emiliania huxleyi CCMP1516]